MTWHVFLSTRGPLLAIITSIPRRTERSFAFSQKLWYRSASTYTDKFGWFADNPGHWPVLTVVIYPDGGTSFYQESELRSVVDEHWRRLRSTIRE